MSESMRQMLECIDPEYVNWMIEDAGQVEVRCQLTSGYFMSGLFDNADALIRAIHARSNLQNIYTSLNAPGLDLIPNRFEDWGRDDSMALTDADIKRIVRIPFDFDPIRPKGQNSTDEEVMAARLCRDMVVSALMEKGWPFPALADSGNGVHALFRCNLPSCDLTRRTFYRLYAGIKSRFADDFDSHGIEFDMKVRNPSRIFRLYGTRNRKCSPTPGRPQRISNVVIPSDWEQVSPFKISRMATIWTREEPINQPGIGTGPRVRGRGDYTTLDMVNWMLSHGLYEHRIDGLKHAIVCPWEHEHSRTDQKRHNDTLIYEANGNWPGFYCHHGHCEGRNLYDLMDFLGDADSFCAKAFQRSRP